MYEKRKHGDYEVWSKSGSVEGIVKPDGQVDLNSVAADRLYRSLCRLAKKEDDSVLRIIMRFARYGAISEEQAKLVLREHALDT